MKGQVSLDILLALVAAIILFGILTIHNENLGANIEETNLQNNLQTILLDTYSAIGTVKAYGVTTKYTSPFLEDCTIVVDPIENGSITVTTSLGESKKYLEIDLSDVIINPATFKCGDIVNISK